MSRAKHYPNGIRNNILVWAGGAVLGFLALVGAFIVFTNNLQYMTTRLIADSSSLEAARRLETVIIDEQRQELLWLKTHEVVYRQHKLAQLGNASIIIDDLHRLAATSAARRRVHEIRNSFEQFREEAIEETELKPLTPDTDDRLLLSQVAAYGDYWGSRMTDATAASLQLNNFVDLCTIIMTIIVLVFVVFGSYSLIDRIIRPTFELVDAAGRLGQGNFVTRTEVHRDDELGMLCNTFNTMAENIHNMEKDRLHFVAALAHDLKNPLLVISLSAQRLRSKKLPPETVAKSLDRIVDQTEFIDGLIGDLTDSVQIRTGQLDLDIEPFNLTDLVGHLATAHAETSSTHRVEFTATEPCFVAADTRRIKRVVQNIISNAIKYSPAGSKVFISVEKHDGSAAVIVRDEGVGIAEEEQHNLFQPFRRLESARRFATGAGMGLYSAKRIMECHSGDIRIASDCGIGTTVEILLPLNDERGGEEG